MDDGAQSVVTIVQVIDQRLAVARVAQVGLKLHDVGVGCLRLDAAAGTDHRMAGLCQFEGQGQPDALAGSGNENGAVHVRGGQLVCPLVATQHTRTVSLLYGLASAAAQGAGSGRGGMQPTG